MEIATLVLAALACVFSLLALLRRPPQSDLSGEDLEKVRQDLLAEIRQTRQELSGRVMAGMQAGANQTEQKLESIRTTMEIYAHLDMTQNRYVPRSVDDLKEF